MLIPMIAICCLLSLVAAAAPGHPAQRPVSIAAASSLIGALHDLTEHESVVLTFGPSSRIAQQVAAGLSADLIITADDQWMEPLTTAGTVVDTRTLVDNQLVVVGTEGLHTARRIGIGAPGVPVGDYAREALHSLGLFEPIQANLVAVPSAAALVAQLQSGTLEAAIVYRSDAVRTPALAPQLTFDASRHRPIRYRIGITERGQHHPPTAALYDRLSSPSTLSTWQEYGFFAPSQGTDRSSAPHPDPIDPIPPALRSVWIAAVALLASLPLAVALGWLLARRTFRGQSLLQTVCLAPLVLPPVVTGWLLLQGAERLGFGLAFTPWAAVVAAAVVGFPLLLILNRRAIEAVDVRYEAQARNLGQSAFGAFRRVTLPMALPGIAAGGVLAFARALGEFGATAMFAGDQPDSTRTLALAVYAAAEHPRSHQTAGVLVGVSLALTFIALLAYEALIRRQRRQQREWS